MFDSIAFAMLLVHENVNPFKPAAVGYYNVNNKYYKSTVLCRQSIAESEMKIFFDLSCLFSILFLSVLVLLSLSSYVVLTFGFVLVTTIFVSL